MATERTLSLSIDASIQIGEALLPFASNVTHDITEYRALSDVRDAPNAAQPIPLGGVPVAAMRSVILRNQADAGSPLRVQVGVATGGTWEAPGAWQPLGELAPGDAAVLPALQPGVILWRGWNRDTDVAALCPAQVVICPL